MWKHSEAKEGRASTRVDNSTLAWMQSKRYVVAKKIVNRIPISLKRFFVVVNDDEIIDVTYVLFHFEFVFYVLIKFVQVNVCEKLARPVSKRHAFASL